jgi:PIN domain nuclease of toxin-antitoxin system
MKQILDTHTFLWFIAGSDELSETAKARISAPNVQNFVSIASLWEIAIKVKLGKLKIKGTIQSISDDLIVNNFEILPINFAHIVQTNELEMHHRDPFDRMIIAQANIENMPIISKDTNFKYYDVKVIW